MDGARLQESGLLGGESSSWEGFGWGHDITSWAVGRRVCPVLQAVGGQGEVLGAGLPSR